ncbi:serine/arginine repetitive matrix protein 2 [Gymnodraco acuticeps]|uniref:Serine/arginine repetitive matrix protein 2 n=1 Tax=Gymnodraco acuticeps TaxID=8218 RepID=A0A6P8TB09_GYMAC|nr:serine/arginine repetitive matrix protein 2 [Gymnodraco acuticeps]
MSERKHPQSQDFQLRTENNKQGMGSYAQKSSPASTASNLSPPQNSTLGSYNQGFAPQLQKDAFQPLAVNQQSPHSSYPSPSSKLGLLGPHSQRGPLIGGQGGSQATSHTACTPTRGDRDQHPHAQSSPANPPATTSSSVPYSHFQPHPGLGHKGPPPASSTSVPQHLQSGPHEAWRYQSRPSSHSLESGIYRPPGLLPQRQQSHNQLVDSRGPTQHQHHVLPPLPLTNSTRTPVITANLPTPQSSCSIGGYGNNRSSTSVTMAAVSTVTTSPPAGCPVNNGSSNSSWQRGREPAPLTSTRGIPGPTPQLDALLQPGCQRGQAAPGNQPYHQQGPNSARPLKGKTSYYAQAELENPPFPSSSSSLFSSGHQRTGDSVITSRLSHPLPSSPHTYRSTAAQPSHSRPAHQSQYALPQAYPQPQLPPPAPISVPQSIEEALDKLDAELEGHMQAEERRSRDREDQVRKLREEERRKKEWEIRQKRDEERKRKEEEERKQRDHDRQEEERRRREWERQEQERKRRQDEERRKRESEMLEEERKRREEEEAEQLMEAERKRRAEVAAALATAKGKWTPLGFLYRKMDTMLDISRERFQGTVLKALSKDPRKDIKSALVKVKEEKLDEEELKKEEEEPKKEEEPKEEEEEPKKEEEPEKEDEEGKQDLKKEEEVMKSEAVQQGGALIGRLVTTIKDEQKHLPFGPEDMISTATMLDGDKVRFNIATHQETKEQRATYVEILPDSFEESTEQRRHGLVIELSLSTGLIKCSQNPQLYFHMCEVIEKKRLELNEKVEFSVVPHETAEGGHQAIRIKRFTEKVFLPTRKLCAIGVAKGKMTIKLAKASEDAEKDKPETDKMKAVVKNLRTQDSKTRKDYGASRRRYGRSRSKSRSPSRSRARSRSKSRSPSRSRAKSPARSRARSRSKSRSPGKSRARSRSPVRSRAKSRSKSKSPLRVQFGRLIKKRRSTSAERRGSRSRKSRSPDRSKRCSKSRSRSRERVEEVKKRSITSRDEALKRRREPSPPPRRGGVVDDELARKKRELDELNDMIAYKKSLVDLDPGQRTCIDYDHGRISVPLSEYKPVRSILKRRGEGPEYPLRAPHPYDDPYYDRKYSAYRYGEPYPAGSYPERPYADRPNSDPPRVYGEPAYAGPPSAGPSYTDRYDVYDEPHGDRYYDPAYAERRYEDPYRSQSPERRDPSPGTQYGHLPAASTQPPLTQTPSTSSSQHPYRPPSPSVPPPRSPSPRPRPGPAAAQQPLDRFLDMLNKKVDVVKQPEPVPLTDDLLPHERALQDGGGFSRIVGLAQEQPGTSIALDQKKTNPKRSSLERTSEEVKNTAEPYDKIQSLLRSIGLKLSTGDMSKLASRAQEKIYSPRSSSTERDMLSSPREERQPSRTGSIESDHIHSPCPARSSSLQPSSQSRAVSEYEGFLDQKELEALQKAQQLQTLTKTMGNNNSPTPPAGPPPTHFQRPPRTSQLAPWDHHPVSPTELQPPQHGNSISSCS